ncbi:MAG TPA: hypothetical protein PKX56_05515, partial [Marmoricola sp.]|nr:hypothetical protein [Marmoricola sp.]HNO40302.1 hypothetical protein [Marmoricola sp.]
MAPEKIEMMVADYQAGIGSWRLARKYAVSSSTVLARLKTAGVELDIAQTKSVKHGLVTDEMVRLRESGGSYKAWSSMSSPMPLLKRVGCWSGCYSDHSSTQLVLAEDAGFEPARALTQPAF